MVTLTENAANEIKRQLAETGSARLSVRIGLEAGGCSGTKYVITPGVARQQDDVATNQFGLMVLCDPITLTSIEGLKIDFVDALMGGGFQYENPQAARSCGCGASFKTAEPVPGNYAQ
jgi:iron-sulfur cluster assembly accessory protein